MILLQAKQNAGHPSDTACIQQSTKGRDITGVFTAQHTTLPSQVKEGRLNVQAES